MNDVLGVDPDRILVGVEEAEQLALGLLDCGR
jgi:hypothetical protein